MTAPHDARLVPAALAAYVVALCSAAGLPWWAATLGAGLTLAAVAARRTRAGGTLTLAATVAVLLAVLCAAHLGARWQGGVDDALASGDSVTLTGVVTRDPQPVLGRGDDVVRARVRLATIAIGDGPSQSTRAEVVVIGGGWDGASYGDRVTFAGRLTPSDGPGREVAVMWDPDLLATAPGSLPDRAVGVLRDGLRGAAAHLPEEVRGLATGVVIGDTRLMPPHQRQDMRVSGLTHLTAVSGAHFAVVIACFGWLLRRMRLGRRARALLVAGGVVGFALLVFPDPSVIRAAWMGLVLVVALWWGRPAQAVPALASAVIALLAIDPWLAASYGFALSVVATAAIVLWSPGIARYLNRWLSPGLARALAVPLAAQVWCAPILLLLQPGVGPYALVANLVAAPLAAPATVMGLLAVVVAPVWPTFAAALMTGVGVLCKPVAWVARAVAGAPGSWLAWPAGWPGLVLMVGISVSLVGLTVARRTGGQGRIAAALVVVALAAAVPQVRAAVGWDPRYPADWSVAFCDVGQGDMALVRAGPASAVVIDVGGAGAGGVECLHALGVREVPLLILTHPHADHDGAVGEVLDVVGIQSAWVSPMGAEGPRADAASALRAAGVPVSIPVVGETRTVGAASVTVLAAGRTTSGSSSDADVNDASVVVWASSGGVSLLAMGDVEDSAQAALDATLPNPVVVDIVKAAHHGSAVQDAALVRSIVAGLAVVSVGEDNTYGHPNDAALSLYREAAGTVLRTDQCGTIAVVRRSTLEVAAGCDVSAARPP